MEIVKCCIEFGYDGDIVMDEGLKKYEYEYYERYIGKCRYCDFKVFNKWKEYKKGITGDCGGKSEDNGDGLKRGYMAIAKGHGILIERKSMRLMEAVDYMKTLDGCTGFNVYCKRDIQINDRGIFHCSFVKHETQYFPHSDWYCYFNDD